MPSNKAGRMAFAAVLSAVLCAAVAPAADAPSAQQATNKTVSGLEREADARPAAVALEVSRSDDIKTRLNDKEIWYKGRLPSKIKATVWCADGKDGARLLGLTKLDRETVAEGPRRFLRFDAQELDERLDGKRVQYLAAGASRGDDLGLKRLCDQPWYELKREAGGTWNVTETAEGEAWPLADALDLGREAALVWPQASFAEFSKGRGVKVRCALPFPAPLAPAPEATVAYTLREVTGAGSDRVGVIDLAGSNSATPQGGVWWGGIRIKGAEVRSTVEGSLKMVLATQKLVEGRIKVDIAVRKNGSSEAFESVYKVESTWRSAESR